MQAESALPVLRNDMRTQRLVTNTMPERERLQDAIAALESQRAVLGEAVVEAALTPMREKLATFDRTNATPSDQTGERKQVTVMFADLSGFTALSETTDAEQVRSLVNGCFGALVPVVEKYGGVVDKFIGDEIMALFGAPATHENDAERALCAALDMIEALAAFNATHRVSLGMHFGIATGRVVAGGLGAEGHQRYSVMGDAVNLAARLGDLSEAGEILVGPATHRMTALLFRFDPRPPVALKGKAEPVAIYRLLGRRAAPSPMRGLRDLRSPLVGRDIEMQAVLAAAYGLARGTGDVLAIIGDAGLGKSRLVADARHSTSESVLWVVGRAVSHAQGDSYAAAGSLLDNLVGIMGEVSRAEVSTALREFVRLRMPGKVDDVFPYLARMRGVPLEIEAEEKIRELLPEVLQGRMRAAFCELIAACATQRPLALVLEDLHWSDPSSLALLDSLVPLTAAAPLLLVPVFRPDEGEAWQWHRKLQREQGTHYRALELSPLGLAESEKLIGNLLRIENLPDSARMLILGKAEGNPFFLEELLRSLIDTGLVRVDGDRVVATDAIVQLQVPDTVQSVVAARIDRLSDDAKRVLQTASVIGRLFPRTILALVLQLEGDGAPLDTPLDELLQRELLRRHGPLEYVFKHAITRDVAYETLLIARRKHLHRRTGEAMEKVFADQLDELAPTLAHHLVAGEAREQAVHYLTRAADRARETYANAEAIAFYRAAIEQVDKLLHDSGKPDDWHEKAAGLRETLGGVLGMIGEVDDALRAYAAARSFVSASDAIAQARLYRRESSALNVARRLPEMLAANERAAAALGPPRDATDRAWWDEWIDLQLERLWGFYATARMPALMALVTETRPVIEARGTSGQRARMFESMVLADLRRFRFYQLPDQTLENVRRQVAAAEASGSRRAIGRAMGIHGFVHLWRDELPEAEQRFGAALRDAEHVGDVETQLIAMNYLALIGRKRDDVAMARHWAKRALNLAEGVKNPFYQASSLGSLGWVAWREGDDTRAQTCLEESMRIAAKAPSPLQFMAVGPLLALATKHCDWPAAAGHARTLAHPSQRKMPDDIQGTLEEAVTSWDGGAAERAGALFREGVEMLRRQATGYV